MGRRLLLGPILIAGFVALMWADEALAAMTFPPALAWLTLPDGRGAPGLILLTLGCLVCGRAAIELARMHRAAGMPASRRVVVFAAVIGVISGGLSIGPPARSLGGMHGGAALATAAALVVALALLVHVRHRDLKGACGAAGAALMAFIYSGVILGFLMAIRTEYSAWVVLGVILTVKSSDMGAYFTGKAIGRHKLIPWISPGKTWEGLVGGILAAGCVGMLMAVTEQQLVTGAPGLGAGMETGGRAAGLSIGHGFAAGMTLGIAGQLGDLSASILKRDAGIKDSGRLLPGMGGIIDLIDSLLFAGPAAFWYLTVVKLLAGQA